MKSSSFGVNICFLFISLFILLIGIAYKPLPEGFPQPWKYRFLSYGAHHVDRIVRMDIVVRFPSDKL